MLLREEILHQALALPTEDRAYLAGALEESLRKLGQESADDAAGNDQVNQALAVELQRRSSAYRAGNSTARSAANVLSDLQQRQAGEISR